MSATLSVRRERVVIPGAGAGARLLYASDLHLRRRDRARAIALVEVVARERPDVTLLGGDLVDAPRGHELLGALVADLVTIAPVIAVVGNHDVFWGARSVRRAVERGGGTFLSGERFTLPTRGGAIAIGDDPDSLGTSTDARPEARVLCGHDPAIFDRAVRAATDLVFAGHLHGGQIVLAQRGERLYPGALFYRYCGLSFERGRTRMLVSRGVADTLPVRFRCPREVIVCEVADAAYV